MSFNFGTPTTSATGLGFGAAAKPAFGNTSFSFGSNAATTSAPTGFGGFGTAPATTNTGFGSYGANPATTNTGFGSFGTNPATTNTGFGGFGANPATTNTGFGGFGGTATSSAGAPGFGAFGSTQSTSAPSLFGGGAGGFGATTTTTPAFPGFGTSTSGGLTSGFGGFGQTNTGFGGTNTGFGGTGTAPAFGAGTGSNFGSTFNTGSAFGNTGFGNATGGAFGGSSFLNKPGGFGTFGSGVGGFGQPQQQQQQQQGPSNFHEALTNAVFNCTVFGDERDQILAKWNFLQAKWGFGKLYYANNQPPLDVTEQNPLCRFKAIGYSCMPTVTDKDGLVQLLFNKSEEEVKNQQSQLVTSLTAIFGNKPNHTINIESVKGMSRSNVQVMIYITFSSTGLSVSRLSASEVAQYLNQPHLRPQLNSLGVSAVLPHVRPDARHLQEYLNTPPPGIDPRLWNQAQADNPDPEKYLPVPMVGFTEVKWRMQCQEEETKLHAAFLAKAATELADLKAKLAATVATLQEQTRRHMHLHHRLLSVVVKQESGRRAGSAMTHEEESLRSRLEALHSQLTAPTQFNGRLSELLSQMRMQRYQNSGPNVDRYTMDPGYQEDIKKVLAQHQKGMTHLIETVQTDLAHIKIIQEGMAAIVQGGVES